MKVAHLFLLDKQESDYCMWLFIVRVTFVYLLWLNTLLLVFNMPEIMFFIR